MVIYTTGDRNFITLITKLKWLHIKAVDQIHTSAYLRMINVLLENIFSIPFWCIILSSQTSVTAGPTAPLSQRAAMTVQTTSDSEGVCVVPTHSWEASPMELNLQTSSLIVCFQNKYMDSVIYCLRVKVECKEQRFIIQTRLI